MHSLRINRIIQLLLTMMTICLSVGCLRENRSGCSDGLFLKFRYSTTYGLIRNSEFPEADHLSVFVFDGNGLFVCEKQDSAVQINDDYTMEFPFYEGQYQFVVWAGLSDCYQIPTCIPGKTRIQDFNLQLARNENNTVSPLPALLYHGWQETVTLNPSKTTEITIGLRRYTNTIQVIVRSANPNIQPQISIEDNNGAYNHQGKMMPDHTLIYLPEYIQPPDIPGIWVANFNVMLLQSGSQALLKINDPEGSLKYNEKLISDLLEANPDINFNTDHDFTIEISFDSYFVAVSILINGWELIPEEVN